MIDSRSPNRCVKYLTPIRRGGGRGAPFNYKSPRKGGVVVKALEGREERQGLDLRRWSYTSLRLKVNYYINNVIDIFKVGSNFALLILCKSNGHK